MEAYQQRVIEEKRDLDEKIEKLTAFLRGVQSCGLDHDERERLVFQKQHMHGYSAILGDRINAFKPAAEEPKIIPPTVGRRVWYWPDVRDKEAGFAYSDAAHPLDAGIAYVWNDRMINISVSDQNGVTHSRTSVQLLQPGDTVPTGAYCQWMPYQLGQAKK